MKHSSSHETLPDAHQDVYSKTLFGFWVYLMSDFLMFATLFSTYAVLQDGTYGGPSAREVFYLPFNLIQTLLFLASNFTIGLAGIYVYRQQKGKVIVLFGLTFFLGAIFFGMQLAEFSRLISKGNGWERSAFLSSYFTLVGTHGIHVFFGLLWILVFLIPFLREGFTETSVRRLTCLRMFWQFLNVIWVFIFTIVYLMGSK